MDRDGLGSGRRGEVERWRRGRGEVERGRCGGVIDGHFFFNNKSAGALFPGGKWKIVVPNAQMISSNKIIRKMLSPK